MSATQTLTIEDCQLGRKAVRTAIRAMAVISTFAMAYSCSTIVLGILVFLVTSIVMAILAYFLNAYVQNAFEPEQFASVGNKIGRVAGFAANLFTRKSKIAA